MNDTYSPMKMEQTECTETSAYKIQTPGNYPEESIQHSEQGGSLKSRIFFSLWRCDATRTRASSLRRFLDHTQRRNTASRTPLDEWSARRRDLYLTTHNTHNRQISMPPVRFEPTISAGERPQIDALDREATGIGNKNRYRSFTSGLFPLQ